MYDILFECLVGEAEQNPIRQHKTVHYGPITAKPSEYQTQGWGDEAVHAFCRLQVQRRFLSGRERLDVCGNGSICPSSGTIFDIHTLLLGNDSLSLSLSEVVWVWRNQRDHSMLNHRRTIPSVQSTETRLLCETIHVHVSKYVHFSQTPFCWWNSVAFSCLKSTSEYNVIAINSHLHFSCYLGLFRFLFFGLPVA